MATHMCLRPCCRACKQYRPSSVDSASFVCPSFGGRLLQFDSAPTCQQIFGSPPSAQLCDSRVKTASRTNATKGLAEVLQDDRGRHPVIPAKVVGHVFVYIVHVRNASLTESAARGLGYCDNPKYRVQPRAARQGFLKAGVELNESCDSRRSAFIHHFSV